jgi:hypothetical protein
MNSALKAQTTVVLSPAIQQKLIQINAAVLAAIPILKDLGLLDAAATLAAGKSLTAQTLSISPATAGQLCRSLSRVPATDTVAAEVGALINSIPLTMRNSRTVVARPTPAHVTPPVRAAQPAPKVATPTKPATPPKTK